MNPSTRSNSSYSIDTANSYGCESQNKSVISNSRRVQPRDLKSPQYSNYGGSEISSETVTSYRSLPKKIGSRQYTKPGMGNVSDQASVSSCTADSYGFQKKDKSDSLAQSIPFGAQPSNYGGSKSSSKSSDSGSTASKYITVTGSRQNSKHALKGMRSMSSMSSMRSLRSSSMSDEGSKSIDTYNKSSVSGNDYFQKIHSDVINLQRHLEQQQQSIRNLSQQIIEKDSLIAQMKEQRDTGVKKQRGVDAKKQQLNNLNQRLPSIIRQQPQLHTATQLCNPYREQHTDAMQPSTYAYPFYMPQNRPLILPVYAMVTVNVLLGGYMQNCFYTPYYQPSMGYF